jgi:hypothetical protein
MGIIDKLKAFFSDADTRVAAAPSTSAKVEPVQAQVVETKAKTGEMCLTTKIVLGKPSRIYIRDECDKILRGRELVMGVPGPNFIHIDGVKVGNLEVLYGGVMDAWQFNSAHKYQIDMPTMAPGICASVAGSYSGLVPEGLKAGDKFEFVVTIRGLEVSSEDEPSAPSSEPPSAEPPNEAA